LSLKKRGEKEQIRRRIQLNFSPSFIDCLKERDKKADLS